MASFDAGLGTLCHSTSIVLLKDVVLDSMTWSLDVWGDNLIARQSRKPLQLKAQGRRSVLVAINQNRGLLADTCSIVEWPPLQLRLRATHPNNFLLIFMFNCTSGNTTTLLKRHAPNDEIEAGKTSAFLNTARSEKVVHLTPWTHQYYRR
jgi:hypothetical protein